MVEKAWTPLLKDESKEGTHLPVIISVQFFESLLNVWISKQQYPIFQWKFFSLRTEKNRYSHKIMPH